MDDELEVAEDDDIKAELEEKRAAMESELAATAETMEQAIASAEEELCNALTEEEGAYKVCRRFSSVTASAINKSILFSEESEKATGEQFSSLFSAVYK
tara:strand:+ start:197 stop:493 length:297 start_codon:yes stop_codon:yes gene_type:complete